MNDSTVSVPAAASGERLDRFLSATLQQSRHQVQKLIRDGLVTVNSQPASVHRWLKTGDRIAVADRPASATAPLPPLQVVAETDDYLVVQKPAGVLVHPAAGSAAPALTAALLKRDPLIAGVGDPGRPGIVHRLDRDVAGLLVVAKTPAMYDELQRQFRERQVKKLYTALVFGAVSKPDGVLTFALARSRTRRGLVAARPRGTDGRPAETRFTVVRRFTHHTLLEVELITGRTHQIRAHLNAFGHAIVGDPLYGASAARAKARDRGLTRPFLQATTLGFRDRQGAWREYTVPLDDELQRFLATLV
jgi:23S rRNA pseudouridine1911/1915/1917 synthase